MRGTDNRKSYRREERGEKIIREENKWESE